MKEGKSSHGDWRIDHENDYSMEIVKNVII